MKLCLDVGNTHIFGGLFQNNELQFQFRYPSTMPSTSDQLGLFFKDVLRENNAKLDAIKNISICSVVPSLNYTIRAAFLKYFSLDPHFIHVKQLNLKIEYKNSHEIGTDRIASAIAACHRYPQSDIIIIDLGTATTFDVITHEGTYLGGVITPGIYIAMKSLHENTAKLSQVNIIKPKQILGQSTVANIQSGLYYAHLGAAREIISKIKHSAFKDREPMIIGTGGFAYLFEDENLFTSIIPDLVLHGLNLIDSKAI